MLSGMSDAGLVMLGKSGKIRARFRVRVVKPIFFMGTCARPSAKRVLVMVMFSHELAHFPEILLEFSPFIKRWLNKHMPMEQKNGAFHRSGNVSRDGSDPYDPTR